MGIGRHLGSNPIESPVHFIKTYWCIWHFVAVEVSIVFLGEKLSIGL
jgi:hypothetical protein